MGYQTQYQSGVKGTLVGATVQCEADPDGVTIDTGAAGNKLRVSPAITGRISALSGVYGGDQFQLDGSGQVNITVPPNGNAVVACWEGVAGVGQLFVTRVDSVTWTIASSAGATDALLTVSWIAY